jgi:hypothetical protein
MNKQEAISRLKSVDVNDAEKMEIWGKFKHKISLDDLRDIYRNAPQKITDEIYRMLHSHKYASSKALDILSRIISARSF